MSLEAIRDSFFSRSFSFEDISVWMAGVGIVCCLLLLFLAAAALRARRARYKPVGRVSGVQEVRRILQLVFDQRRGLEVQFENLNDSRRPTLRSSLHSLEDTHMVLNITGVQRLPGSRWEGRPLHVFFAVSIGGQLVHYTFNSQIEAIEAVTGRSDEFLLTVPLPPVLDNRQKRAFLRMMPPPEFMLGAALWQGKSMPADSALYDIALWPRPSLLLLPGRMEQFGIMNLSAGGVRLNVARRYARENDVAFSALETLIVMLDLFDPESSKRMRFWLQCRVQSIHTDPGTGDLLVGAQFLAWAKPGDAGPQEKPSEIEWLRLSSSNEVEPIGNWIMRRHLELFRDTPESALAS